MNIKQQSLENAIDAAGLEDEVRILPSYSGRGMYGKECVAFTCASVRQAVRVMIFLMDEDHDAALPMSQRLCTDGFGTGIVVYFPGIQVEDE